MKKFVLFIFTLIFAFTFFYVVNAPEADNAKPVSKQIKKQEEVNSVTSSRELIYKEEHEKELFEAVTTTEKTKEIIENNTVLTEQSVENPEETIKEELLKCSLSVRCDTILSNMENFKKEKIDFIPSDGVVYKEKEIVFYENESVFNVLMRELKQNGIHLEFMKTPVIESAYIEGINNIYEFDCGELSGWMYKVNGEFPPRSCSEYFLKDGDVIEWVYTCDLGKDVGEKRGIGRQKDN